MSALTSHDRAFLERVVTHVVEIDEHSHGASGYAGGWAAYLEEKDAAGRHAAQAYAGYVEQKSTLENRARRLRQWATKGVAGERRNMPDNDKAARDWRINRTEKNASAARRADAAAGRLEVVDKPWERWQLKMDIAATERSGDLVAELAGAVVGARPLQNRSARPPRLPTASGCASPDAMAPVSRR